MSLAPVATVSPSSEHARPVSIVIPTRILAVLRNMRTAKLGPISKNIDPAIYSMPRNFDIFPHTLGPITPTKQPFEQPAQYTLSQLRGMLQKYREEDHYDSIFVSSAKYCKQSDNLQHEFLLLEVFDNRVPEISNFLILDRTVQSSRSSGHFASTSDSSSSSPAHDRVRVSGYGNPGLLNKQCNLRSHSVLEHLDFPSPHSSKPLLLYEVIILAFETSQSRRMYDLMSAQCFWFSCCVWECMQALSPDAVGVSVAKTRIRGKFRSILQQTVNWTEVADIVYKTRSEIRQFQLDYRRAQEKTGRKNLIAVEEKCEAMRRESKRMKEEIDLLNATARGR